MTELFVIVIALLFATLTIVALIYVRDMFNIFSKYLESQQKLISETKVILDRISLNYSKGYFDEELESLEVASTEPGGLE